MKNPLIIIALTLSSVIYAQAPFEGQITYSITTKGNAIENETLNQSNEVIAYFKDGKTRFDITSPEFDFHLITNETDKNATFMVEIKGDFSLTMALNTNIEDLKTEFGIEETPQIHYSRATKNIAGYKCKKVIIKTNDGEMHAYTTETINAKNLNWLLNESIKGTLLEFTVANNENNEGATLKATEVRKMTVQDSQFEVPPGCISVNIDGLKEMIGEDGLF